MCVVGNTDHPVCPAAQMLSTKHGVISVYMSTWQTNAVCCRFKWNSKVAMASYTQSKKLFWYNKLQCIIGIHRFFPMR